MRERIAEHFENRLETPEEIREKLKNPKYLPSLEEIKKAFNNLKDRKEWDKFCRGREWGSGNDPVYEFLNKEFISVFGDYLVKRAKELGAAKEKPILILEVGAGNGRLTHFLEKRFKEKSSKERLPEIIKIIATDSGEWWGPPDYFIKKPSPPIKVEKIPYHKALLKYNPNIVISSWMETGQDWTDAFRHQKSVKEYILIGEAGFGRCGHPWRTWGEYSPDEEKEYEDKIPPYKADGFEKENLNEISKYQICRNDYLHEKGDIVQHSKTVSFRRKLKEAPLVDFLPEKM